MNTVVQDLDILRQLVAPRPTFELHWVLLRENHRWQLCVKIPLERAENCLR
jgi:hypothetical protein